MVDTAAMRLLPLALLASYAAFGAQVTVLSPCEGTAWLNVDVPAQAGQSVGRVSVGAFAQNRLPFTGSENGILSIRNTVTGDRALEVVSDREMRAYGWCFLVNGYEAKKMPSQIPLSSSSERITWFFGYAHYRDGKWISMCTPTYKTRPRFICGY